MIFILDDCRFLGFEFVIDFSVCNTLVLCTPLFKSLAVDMHCELINPYCAAFIDLRILLYICILHFYIKYLQTSSFVAYIKNVVCNHRLFHIYIYIYIYIVIVILFYFILWSPFMPSRNYMKFSLININVSNIPSKLLSY